MADQVVVDTLNFQELQRAFSEAPRQTALFVGQEMKRFAARFRKAFIKARMSGGSGIKWSNQRSIGKNVQSNVTGSRLEDLTYTAKISRFLRVHEEGATISGKPWLFLSKKTGAAGKGKIFARVRSVRIQARLGFLPMAQEQIRTDLTPRIEKAMTRAMQVSFEQNMKSLSQAIGALSRV